MEVLQQVAHAVSLGLDAMALVVIVIGAVQAVLGIARVVFKPTMPEHEKHAVWLEFSHWLVAALTFQLAADIVNTMIVPGWDDIGRVAAIAVIRTFLTFFLDRDIDKLRERSATGGHHAGSV